MKGNQGFIKRYLSLGISLQFSKVLLAEVHQLLMLNVSSPDNLVAVQSRIDEAGLRSDVRMINIARGQYQLDRVRFDALNPTFLVLGSK